MKATLTFLLVVRGICWTLLIPWLCVVGGMLVMVLSKRGSNAVQEASIAAIACAAAFIPYAAVKALDKVIESIGEVVELWK